IELGSLGARAVPAAGIGAAASRLKDGCPPLVQTAAGFSASELSARLAEQFAADQPAADLRSAGADLVELGVAQEAAGRIVVDIAVAAEALDRFERHPGRPLGGVEDDAGGILARRVAAVARAGDG